MRTLVNGTLTVQAYDAKVWLQEHNVLRIKDTGATIVSIGTTPSQFMATYTLDENHEVIVDMSDYIRTNAAATDIFVRSDSGGAVFVDANYEPVGLINPENVIVPENINRERVLEYTGARQYFTNVIVPPQRMLKDLGTEETRIVCEFYPDNEVNETMLDYLWGLDFSEPKSVSQTMTVELGADDIRTWTDEAPGIGVATIQKVHLQPLECDKRYAAVRWVSFTGATRLHTFELVKAKTETRDATSLLTVDGSYNTIKGRTDSFTLRMEGLNAYDYWYYSDMIHSSLVEVSVDGKTWQQVDVTNRDTTTPDGNAGGLNTLEINVNWRKYDAFNM